MAPLDCHDRDSPQLSIRMLSEVCIRLGISSLEHHYWSTPVSPMLSSSYTRERRVLLPKYVQLE